MAGPVEIAARMTEEFLRPVKVYDIKLPDGRWYGGAKTMTEARSVARRMAPGVPVVVVMK